MGDMYISGGENVYPAEVERVLLNHPKIFEAAIVGVPDEKWGRSGHAFIHPKPGEVIDSDEMVSYLRDKVASYKIPKSMEILKAFSKDRLWKNQTATAARADDKRPPQAILTLTKRR